MINSREQGLRAGYSLIMPSETTMHDFDPNKGLLREYQAIRRVIAGIIGEDRIAETDKIQALDGHFHLWPRNAHVVIDHIAYVDPDAWNIDNTQVVKTTFGNGGAVLTRGRAVIAVDNCLAYAEEEADQLRAKGLRVGILPIVCPHGQKCDFARDDIDCHAALVESPSRGYHLVVAGSYFNQDEVTQRQIRRAAEDAQVKLEVVDDQNLPPLSLNIQQFDDLTIVMTSGAEALENHFVSLVGREKVRTTDVPIATIPELGHAGIGCLTNITPNFLIESRS